MRDRITGFVSFRGYMESLRPNQSGIFCLECGLGLHPLKRLLSEERVYTCKEVWIVSQGRGDSWSSVPLLCNAQVLWCLLLTIFQVQCVMLDSVQSILKCWKDGFMLRSKQKPWMIASVSYWWFGEKEGDAFLKIRIPIWEAQNGHIA